MRLAGRRLSNFGSRVTPVIEERSGREAASMISGSLYCFTLFRSNSSALLSEDRLSLSGSALILR